MYRKEKFPTNYIFIHCDCEMFFVIFEGYVIVKIFCFSTFLEKQKLLFINQMFYE